MGRAVGGVGCRRRFASGAIVHRWRARRAIGARGAHAIAPRAVRVTTRSRYALGAIAAAIAGSIASSAMRVTASCAACANGVRRAGCIVPAAAAAM